MYADIEDLVLSGKLFSNSRSSSPVRTPSPDAGWHDDELNSDDEKGRPYQHQRLPDEQQHESVGMGPGRTGVKGVIRDRNEAQINARNKRALEIAELNKRMEKASLGGKSFLEEEREREIEKRMMEGPGGKDEDKTDMFGRKKEGRFGHLREVGLQGFVDSVEQEEKGVWVVVHLYEPSVDRCYTLDETLARLARVHPDTKFLRSRAAALGFATTPSLSVSLPSRARLETHTTRSHTHGDDDDPYADDNYDEFDHDTEYLDYDEDSVDTDMLPTMLVYHDGKLVFNWVRVDWEAGRAGVEELLIKHHILPQSYTMEGIDGLLSDDEDDLI
ncbi:hypothetical protein PILCRDRAFT_826866 [Piloderma croceum F 1598]|uniref:Phosducin domain-containing protein n=1 Tax=Piloderma croceum (strain F 1598) TaxID=765440 RepID=A0A0C3ETH3_PILCF|nr:hypothetical protein PILCRDRAFT_826866 [Piloderma croceum F 1598]